MALVGRSNAGKSSLVNALIKKKLAYVSQSPGKTMHLNFYDIGDHYRLVDMPGYGFAARSHKEQKHWKKMIETYLSNRQNLNGLILVIDGRRKWTEDEEALKLWCESYNVPLLVCMTKTDQLKQNEKRKQYDYFLKSTLCPVFLTSASKKIGIKELEDFIFKSWIKNDSL